MRWFIKRHIFNLKKMLIIETELSTYKSAFLDRRKIRKKPVSIYRAITIDHDLEKKLKTAFVRLDILQYFDMADIRERISKGFYFHVVEMEDEIIGWAWSAVDKVYFDDFFADLKIDKNTVFSYNFYIDTRFRGTGLPYLLIDQVLTDLRDNKHSLFWGLCYPDNKQVLAFNKMTNGRIVGNFYFLRLLWWTFTYKKYFTEK